MHVHERKAIVAKYSGLWMKKPDEIELPQPHGPPLSILGDPLDALQCEQDGCNYITQNNNVFGIHCREKHKITWRGKESILSEKVKVQTFYRTEGLQRYFVVAVPVGSRDATGLPADVKTEVDTILSEWSVVKAEHEEEMQVMQRSRRQQDRLVHSDRVPAAFQEERSQPSCTCRATAGKGRAEAQASSTSGGNADRAECCRAVNRGARDSTLAEKCSARRSRSTADGKAAKPGESGDVCWILR